MSLVSTHGLEISALSVFRRLAELKPDHWVFAEPELVHASDNNESGLVRDHLCSYEAYRMTGSVRGDCVAGEPDLAPGLGQQVEHKQVAEVRLAGVLPPEHNQSLDCLKRAYSSRRDTWRAGTADLAARLWT